MLKKRLMLRQTPVCSRIQSYVRWISVVYMATDQHTLPWPSHRPIPLKILAINPSKNSHRFRHLIHPTPRLPEAARPLTIKLGERRKNIDVWINSKTRVEKTLAPLLPPALIVRLGKSSSRLRASIITKKGTTRRTALSPEKKCQKTSIVLGNFHSNNWP